MNNELDYNALAHIFSVPVKAKKSKAKREYMINGKKAHVERVSSREWEGWFDGESSTYIADTKRELLADMGL